MNLTKNITLSEMTRTDHRQYADANYRRAATDPHILANLVSVATLLGQPIRDHFNAPLIPGSGYRFPGLNKLIGGSATSQHMLGEALDFHIAGVPLMAVFAWIRCESGLAWGQLILEGIQADVPTWIHISLGYPWRAQEKCNQILVWDKAHGYHSL